MLKILLCLALTVGLVGGTELTFELLQHDKQCFYEEIEAGMEATLEFQVRFYINRKGIVKYLYFKHHCVASLCLTVELLDIYNKCTCI